MKETAVFQFFVTCSSQPRLCGAGSGVLFLALTVWHCVLHGPPVGIFFSLFFGKPNFSKGGRTKNVVLQVERDMTPNSIFHSDYFMLDGWWWYFFFVLRVLVFSSLLFGISSDRFLISFIYQEWLFICPFFDSHWHQLHCVTLYSFNVTDDTINRSVLATTAHTVSVDDALSTTDSTVHIFIYHLSMAEGGRSRLFTVSQ